MQPISRCGSSYLTEGLLSFRNPLGKDENWLAQPQVVDNYVLFAGRVITTQLALPLLTLSALVESGVYPVFAAGFFLAKHVVEIPSFLKAEQWLDRASSARFTVIWTLGDFFLFNLFCKNVFTHESLARYSLDNPSSQRGRIWHVVLAAFAATVSFILSSFAAAIVIEATIGIGALGISFVMRCVTTYAQLGLSYFIFHKVSSVMHGLKAQRQYDEAYVRGFLGQHRQLTIALTGKNFLRAILNLSPEELEVIFAIHNGDEQEAALRALYETHWRQATEEAFPPVDISLELDDLLDIYGPANSARLNLDPTVLGIKCFKDHILDASDVDDKGGH